MRRSAYPCVQIWLYAISGLSAFDQGDVRHLLSGGQSPAQFRDRTENARLAANPDILRGAKMGNVDILRDSIFNYLGYDG